MPDPLFSVAVLQKDILRVLNDWHSLTDDHPLRYLRVTVSSSARTPAARIKEHLTGLIAQLPNELAILLRQRFFDERSGFEAGLTLSLAESTVFRKQRQAIAQLAEWLYNQEKQIRAERRARFEGRLESPTYAELIGMEAQSDQIAEILVQDGPPWLFLVQGIGGIGKTSLTDAILRRLIDEDSFENYGWVTARRSLFRLDGSIWPASAPALSAETLIERLAVQILSQSVPSPFSFERTLALLQSQMKAERHLIVVDNLETVADLDALLPALQRLVNPSKILITSRESLDAEPSVYPFKIGPLGENDSLTLLRREARARNLPSLAQADDAILRSVFATVGGNPLALRLVVGQACRHPMTTVLDDLRQARGRTVESLYTFLYRRVWESLDENEKAVLLAMPLTPPNGSDLGYLAEVAELESALVHDALARLTRLNVVDYRGDLSQGRYTIHSLTRTFLLEQVIRWQREEAM